MPNIKQLQSKPVTAKLSDLQKKYRKYFRGTMKEWEVKSPAQLEEDQKPKFFTQIKKGWRKEKRAEKKS